MVPEFCIYAIFNKINGKIYIGKTNDYERRMKRHIAASNNRNGERVCVIHHALRKYGASNFAFTVLQKLENDEDCLEAEKYWIKHFSSNIREFGYNLTEGGEGGVGLVHTEQTRKKMSEKATGRKHTPETIEKLKQRKQSLPGRMPTNLEQLKIMNIGRKHTDTAKENMSLGRIGMKFSEEHKRNMSLVRVGLFEGEKNPFYGKTHTEETKILLRGENNKQSKLQAHRVVEIRERYDSGNYSQHQLACEYGVSRSQIRRIINGTNWKHI